MLHWVRAKRVGWKKLEGWELDLVQGGLQQVGESIRKLREEALSTYGSAAVADAALARSDEHRRLITLRGKLKTMAAELNEQIRRRRQNIASLDAEMERRTAARKFRRHRSRWK
jgi:hypothetical protein